MIETKTMAQLVEMSGKDNHELLRRVGYGHLGCARDNRPYVVPIHYAFDEPHIYIFTTEGKKSEIIAENPTVCLQVEEVTDGKNWQSVIVRGEAEQLTAKKEIDRAMKLILAGNPNLTPALGIRWMDSWVRVITPIVYRIIPTTITGRTTIDRAKH